jgi:hypothetical protein
MSLSLKECWNEYELCHGWSATDFVAGGNFDSVLAEVAELYCGVLPHPLWVGGASAIGVVISRLQ